MADTNNDAPKLLTLDVFEHAVERLDRIFQRKEDGKGLSTNDYDNEAKAKLDGIDANIRFATAEEVDEILDQYFPGDVDPDEPIEESGGESSGGNAEVIDGDDPVDDEL